MLFSKLAQAKEMLENEAGIDIAPNHLFHSNIEWVVVIDGDGNLLDFLSQDDLRGEDEDDDAPVKRLVPKRYIGRSGGGCSPQLITDTAKYVFGLAGKKHQRHRRAYLEMLRIAAEELQHPPVDAILRCVEGLDPSDAPEDMEHNHLITFQVDGEMIYEDDIVNNYWVNLIESILNEGARWGQCCICMEERPLARRLGATVHPPGNEIVAIAGSNKKSFEGYGNKEGYNAHICTDCALDASNTLNALFRSDNHHLSINNTWCVFWSPEDPALDYFSGLLTSIETQNDLRKKLAAHLRTTNVIPDYGVEGNFYYAQFSTHQKRLIVNRFVDINLSQARENLRRWLEAVEIGYHDPLKLKMRRFRYHSIFRLLGGLLADGQKLFEDTPPPVFRAMLDAVLLGHPLPEYILKQALTRLRIEPPILSSKDEHGNSRPRIASLKAYLMINEGETELMPELNRDVSNVGYHLGRLFALMEFVQDKSKRPSQDNSIRRLYAAAMDNPQGVLLDEIVKRDRHHIDALQKNNVRSDRLRLLEKMQEQIMADVMKICGGELPRILRPTDRAFFAIGTAQQRAECHEAWERSYEDDKKGEDVEDE